MNYRASAERISAGHDITVDTEADKVRVLEQLYLIEKEHRKNFHPLGKVIVKE